MALWDLMAHGYLQATAKDNNVDSNNAKNRDTWAIHIKRLEDHLSLVRCAPCGSVLLNGVRMGSRDRCRCVEKWHSVQLASRHNPKGRQKVTST